MSLVRKNPEVFISSIMHSQPFLIFSYIIWCDKMCHFFFSTGLVQCLAKGVTVGICPEGNQQPPLQTSKKLLLIPAKLTPMDIRGSTTAELLYFGLEFVLISFNPYDIDQKIRIINCFKVNQVNYCLKHLMTLEEKGSKCRQCCGNAFFLLFNKTRDTKPVFRVTYLVYKHFMILCIFPKLWSTDALSQYTFLS